MGKEFDLDLQLVFIGLLEPWDMVCTLEERGLVSPYEVDALFYLVETERYSELRIRYNKRIGAITNALLNWGE